MKKTVNRIARWVITTTPRAQYPAVASIPGFTQSTLQQNEGTFPSLCFVIIRRPDNTLRDMILRLQDLINIHNFSQFSTNVET